MNTGGIKSNYLEFSRICTIGETNEKEMNRKTMNHLLKNIHKKSEIVYM
ncbi:hypothetical protein [Bacillus anthracis]|nr:hypothetical protein [Bacillus anthracis]EEM56757.1 hypothetical protein bthur0007_53910 [Bacillus thuringiensis serovar monterrey BGSC 4AJ1]MEB9674049.1 hypothetical protein [Bacillus anthracis]